MNDLSDFGIKKLEATLSNGSRVVLFQKPGAPIYIRAYFLSGSRFDPVGKEGLSHFVEHMLVAGSKGYPSKDKLAAYIEAQGGVFSAFTSYDSVAVDVEVADASDITTATTILRAILTEALFDPTTIETERGSILKEIGDKESNPGAYIWEVCKRLFYQNNLFSRPTLGTRDALNSINREDLLEFYETGFTANRMVIVASGDIKLEQLITQLNTDVPVSIGKKNVKTEKLVQSRKKNIDIQHFSGEQVHLMFGFRSPPEVSSDDIPLSLIATILGGGRAAVLTRRLRYERGLVYGVSAGQYGMSDTGLWIVKSSTSKNDLPEVLKIITEEISRAYEGGLLESELKFAKDKVIKSRRRAMQTSESWVDAHALGQLVNPDKALDLNQWLQEVENTTIDSLKLSARRFLKPKSWYLALCGDLRVDDVEINY
jgi:predicted Zn-dependent peptidase